MKLEGKVAVVTGGASGIGLETGRLFAKEGATVVLLDRDEDAVRSAATDIGGSATGLKTDVSRSVDIDVAVRDVLARHGRIDVLVNNAGYGVAGTILDVPEDAWDALMATNLKGVYLVSRAVIPAMIAQGGGVVVNVGSYTATTAIKNRAAYVASKGGVVALSRAMALDHINDNIRVNCIAPGTVHSPYFDRILAEAPNAEDARAELDARAPVGRMGRPAEIAQAILFLASDDSSFIVGSVLTADGGTTAW